MKFKGQYSQPDFYKFSGSSIKLSKFAFERNKKSQVICDLFAGSGVLGIEYYNKRAELDEVTFIEKQVNFLPHLKENSQHIPCSKFLIKDFRDYNSDSFDMILANPPFFHVDSSRPNESEERDKCMRRNFMLEEVFQWIKENLRNNGEAFLLLPIGEHKFINEQKILKLIESVKINERELIVLMRLDIK